MEEVEELAKNIDEIKLSLKKLETKEKPIKMGPQNASAMLAIKSFSGDIQDPNTNLEEFEKQFLLVANALEWSEKQQAAMLPLYLSGHAKETYHTLEEDDKRSIGDLLGALRRIFHSSGMDSFISMQLRDRKQGPRESVAEYVSDIKKLSRLAFASEPDITKEALARDAFIAGLRPSLKMAVMRSGTRHLDEAVLIASKEEVTQKVLQVDAQRSKGEVDVAALTTCVDKLVSTLQMNNKPQPQQRFGYNPQPTAEWTTAGFPRCYNCGRQGHIARVCTQQRYTRPPPAHPINSNRFENRRRVPQHQTTSMRPRGPPQNFPRTPTNRQYTQPSPHSYTPTAYRYQPEEYRGQWQRFNGRHQTHRGYQPTNRDQQRTGINALEAEDSAREDDYSAEDEALLRALREEEPNAVAFCDIRIAPSAGNKDRIKKHRPPINRMRTAVFPSMSITWLLLFSIVAIQPTDTSVKTGLPMLCQTKSGRSAFRFPTNVKCPKVPRVHARRQRVTLELYKENIIKYASKGYHCIISKQTTETFSYFFGDHNLKKSNTSFLTVTELECQMMIKTRTCSYGRLKAKNDHFTTAKKHIWFFPGPLWNCCHWKKFETINCFLVPIKVYKRHSEKQMEASFGAAKECDYEREKCTLKDGSFLSWKARTEEKCSHVFYRRMNGQLWDHTWLAYNHQLALSFPAIPRALPNCNNTVLTYTDQGVMIKVNRDIQTYLLSKKMPNRRRRKAVEDGAMECYEATTMPNSQIRILHRAYMITITNDTTIKGREYDGQTQIYGKFVCIVGKQTKRRRFKRAGIISAEYVASRLQALHVMVMQYSNRVFGLLIAKICSNTQFAASVLKTAILADPTLAIRSLFNQEYIHAKAQTNSVQTWPCAPVVSYNIQPMAKHCTKYLPIRFSVHGMQLEGFLNAKTNIIHQTSPKVACKEVDVIPVCLEGKCYNYRKDGTREGIETNKTLPFIDTNFLTIPKAPPTTYYQLTIYNWSEIQSQESWADLAQSMKTHSEILENIGAKQTDPLYQQARKYINVLASKTTFGFLTGLKIDWKQMWIFAVCFYTTMQVLYLALMYTCPTKRVYSSIRQKIRQKLEYRRRQTARRRARNEQQEGVNEIEMQDGGDTTRPSITEPTPPRRGTQVLAEVLRNTRQGSIETNHTIATIFPQVRSTLMIKVNGIPTEALWDTGSALTLIDYKWAMDHGVSIKEIESTATTINGSPVQIIGTTKVKFQIGSISMGITAKILENATLPCVLGVDTLQLLPPFTFDYTKRTVRIGNTSLPLSPKQTFTSRVAAVETIEIPPNTMAHVMAKIESSTSNSTALFEPQTKYAAYPVRIFDTMGRAKDQMFPLLLTNYAKFPIKIYENETLGHIEPVLQNTVKEETNNQITNLSNNSARNKRPLLSLFELNDMNLTSHQMEQLKATLTRYESAFSKDEYDLGHLTIGQHKINTGDHQPVRQRAYRVPQVQKENLKNHIEKMLQQGIIRPSSSPFASPCVLVAKKDGSTRFCVDYRKLNQITYPQFQPLPYLEQITESLHGAKYLTTLDLQAGYHQIDVAEEDQHKTAFITPFGCYEFLRLPFGLSNSPATFVAALDIVLAGLQYVDCIAYLDDIIIFAKTFEEHMQKLERVLQRLMEYGLKLKPSKCQFVRQKVQFLGHTITPNGLSPIPTNIEKIVKYPKPKNAKQVRQFLGLAGYYRKFIQNFANIATPLFNLVKKDAKFTWGPDHETAFTTLRDSLVSAPVLIFPDFSEPFYLQTDASEFAVGAVLSQITPEGDKPIAFTSKSLTKSEKHFAVVEKEAYALLLAVKHFKEYLWGRKFFAIVDHAPLKYLLNHRDSNSRLMRWSLFLQQFNFEIIYRPGKKHTNADVMSRLPQQDEVAVITELSANTDVATMRQLQQEEPLFRAIMDKVRNVPISHALTRVQKQFVTARWPQFRIKDDLLYHMGPQGQLRLALPEDGRKKIFIELHSALFGAHLGYEKTLSRIAKFYYWPNMTDNILSWCNECVACATRKQPKIKIKVPLVPIIATKPMEIVGVDVVGPLPISSNQNRFIVVFVCLFTRWVEAYAVPSQKSEVVARLFVEQFVATHGTPQRLLSDRGPNFTSELFREICKLTNTDKVYTTAFHPECDGQVENFNKTLVNMLSFYTSRHQKDWDTHIPYVLHAYRTSEHASTKETPFYLMFGRHARHFHDLAFSPMDDKEQSIEDYRHELVEKLTLAWQVAGDNARAAKEKQKKYYDKRVTFSSDRLRIGDRVFLHVPYAPKGKCSKLLHHWRGPYRILEVTPTNCRILSVSEPKSKAFWVHLNRLKLDNASDPIPPNENLSPQDIVEPDPNELRVQETTSDDEANEDRRSEEPPEVATRGEQRYPLRRKPVQYPK